MSTAMAKSKLSMTGNLSGQLLEPVSQHDLAVTTYAVDDMLIRSV
jgi:hypothetical protein